MTVAAPFKHVEAFRVGTHTDSAGRTRTFTEADLDRIASYDPTHHEAPMVIGHPTDTAPAYGWVERVYREGPTLFMDFKGVQPEFEDAVRRGLFKKRSISLYPDGSLRHVGWLGANPPAIKGFKDVQFSEGEATTYEFGEERQDADKSLFTRFAEAFLGLVAPGYADKPAGGPAFKEAPMPGSSTDLMPQVAALTAKMTEFSEALAAKDKRIADLESANQALSHRMDATVATGRKGEIAAFCDRLAGEGRLTSYQQGVAATLLEKLDAAGLIDFAEGDKTIQKPAGEVFRAMLETLPVQVEYGEFATHSRAAGNPGEMSPAEQAGKIQDEVDKAEAAGRTMSYAEASAKVLREQKEGTR